MVVTSKWYKSNHMIRYISGIHLLDSKCVSYDNRPFGNLESMHDWIEHMWNDVVRKDETEAITIYK